MSGSSTTSATPSPTPTIPPVCNARRAPSRGSPPRMPSRCNWWSVPAGRARRSDRGTICHSRRFRREWRSNSAAGSIAKPVFHSHRTMISPISTGRWRGGSSPISSEVCGSPSNGDGRFVSMRRNWVAMEASRLSSRKIMPSPCSARRCACSRGSRPNTDSTSGRFWAATGGSCCGPAISRFRNWRNGSVMRSWRRAAGFRAQRPIAMACGPFRQSGSWWPRRVAAKSRSSCHRTNGSTSRLSRPKRWRSPPLFPTGAQRMASHRSSSDSIAVMKD